MKYNIYDSLRDKQQDPPEYYCDHCKGEIYQYDECYLIGSTVICEHCLEDFEKEERSSIYGYELDDYFNTYGGLDDIE